MVARVGDYQRAAYQTSKAGINALTRHIACRWDKQGIRGLRLTGAVLTESAERWT